MSSDGPPFPPSTKKGRATVRSLMDAAVVVFDRDGYIGSRISDISAEAGLSNGAFYRYFADKRHIMVMILNEFTDGSNHFVSTPFVPEDPILSVRTSTVRHLEHYRDNAKLHGLMTEVGQVDPEIEQMRVQGYQQWFGRIARMLRRAEGLGLLQPGLDPDAAAALLGGMAEQYAYLVYVRGLDLPSDPEVVAEQIVTLWQSGAFVNRD